MTEDATEKDVRARAVRTMVGEIYKLHLYHNATT